MYTKEELLERRTKLSESNQGLLKKRLQGNVDGNVELTTTIPRRSGEQPAPLSFLQERLLFLFEWEPDSPIYNEPQIVRIRGKMDVKALEDACLEIMRRHEILRTVYQYIDGTPVQMLVPHSGWLLPVIDLRQMPADRREAEVQWLTKHEANRPFDLKRDFSWRVLLARLTEEDNVLFITQHHISCDGWSINLRNNEMTILYAAFAAGKPSPLPELPIQYADFACWQRQQLQGSTLQKSLAYWRQQLAGFTPLLLPTDRPRTPVPTSKGATQRDVLPAALARALTTFSQQSKFTGFTIALAVFKTLLCRYMGQTDIAVGTLFANRDQPELVGVIGFFIETIVLRTDLSGNPTFRELLERVYKVSLEAYAHQGVSLDQIISELQPKRNPSQDRPIRILFDWQEDINHLPTNLQVPSDSLNKFVIEGEQTYADAARFDIWMSIRRVGEDLVLWAEYNTDLFDASTISRLFGHFQTLLSGALAHPDTRLSDLPLLTTAEQQQLLGAWNDTAKDYSLEPCIHELFEAQVQRTPDAIAVACDEAHLTYEQLNQRANCLASVLVERNVGPDTIVPLFAHRGFDFLLGMLAVFKAGGAYLPLDLRDPAQRTRQLLKQSRSRLLVAAKELMPVLSDILEDLPVEERPLVLCVSDALTQEYPADNLPTRCTPHHMAYVIYTSGSTGMPKGAMVEQRGMINHLYAKVHDLQLTDDDIIAQTAPQSFDISVWQFLVALIVGGRVQIFRDDVAFDPARLPGQVSLHQITVLETVPSLLRAVLALRSRSGFEHESLRSLRWLMLTGEALPPDLAHQWLHWYPDIALINAYGPTECSDDVTHYPFDCLPDANVSLIPIGRPIINTRLYVLDAWLQPVPVGIAGELYVGGVGVGRGYLYEPEKTAKAFIPDPFSPEPGARLYKTGDLVYYRSNGNLEFMGRVDYQVKIRGQRIELGEIQAVLNQHTAVREAALVMREDKPGDKYLVAYVVADQGQPLETHELYHFLQEKLPPYMVPSAFVMLDEMPLTSNGKVNLRLLPIPERIRPDLRNVMVPPRTETEEMLAEIWVQVLGIDAVGIYDNFFELGGHSMLSIQLMAQIQDTFQVELSLHHFFERPIIAELGLVIDKILLDEIENLSEEEVLQLLQDET